MQIRVWIIHSRLQYLQVADVSSMPCDGTNKDVPRVPLILPVTAHCRAVAPRLSLQHSLLVARHPMLVGRECMPTLPDACFSACGSDVEDVFCAIDACSLPKLDANLSCPLQGQQEPVQML